MKKSELINAVADSACLTKGGAGNVVDAVFAAITAAMKSGDEVRLVGFGTFWVTARPAREGRNPQTGNTLTIAASKSAKFTAGKNLKDTINGR